MAGTREIFAVLKIGGRMHGHSRGRLGFHWDFFFFDLAVESAPPGATAQAERKRRAFGGGGALGEVSSWHSQE